MPLPLILAGAAVIAGGYGVKKGFDAKEDFDRAEELNIEAQDIHEEAEEKLAQARDRTKASMEKVGKQKLAVYRDSLIPFVDVFKEIKNVDFKDNLTGGNKVALTEEDFKQLETSAFEMKEVVGGGVAALGSGGLAGLAAYGSVGLLGTASTGTAIGSLSGVAATNATLAWLGGGSLASGGLGMAGGTAVLGGIVAGPILAVGGAIAASKAEEAKENAHSNLAQAKVLAKEFESAIVTTDGISMRFDEIHNVLAELVERFEPLLEELEDLIDNNRDYSAYSKQDRIGVYNTAMLAKTIKKLTDAPVLEEDGSLSTRSSRMLRRARKELTAK